MKPIQLRMYSQNRPSPLQLTDRYESVDCDTIPEAHAKAEELLHMGPYQRDWLRQFKLFVTTRKTRDCEPRIVGIWCWCAGRGWVAPDWGDR